MKEEWKIIEEYPDYLISNKGRIRSLKYGKDVIMKPALTTDGYETISLYKNGSSKNIKIHRLVMIHFKPMSDNNLIINHIDGNKLNNKINNLEWCTHSHNIKHAFDNKLKESLKGEDSNLSKLKNEDVIEIRRLLSTTNMTNREIAEMYNLHVVTVSHIKTRKTWKHI